MYTCQQNSDLYDGMRNLIQDPENWRTEEEHFRTVNMEVYHYHLRQDPRIQWAQIESCPPLVVLRNLWLAVYEEAMQQKALARAQLEQLEQLE